MSFATFTSDLFQKWRDKSETRRALERLRSEELIAELGYNLDMADAETRRWFFQPLLGETMADSSIERITAQTPTREKRYAAGLPPLLFPARA
ncbi:MAG: hypothetical protein AAFY56_02605 [Pseudomonadota bacterium]